MYYSQEPGNNFAGPLKIHDCTVLKFATPKQTSLHNVFASIHVCGGFVSTTYFVVRAASGRCRAGHTPYLHRGLVQTLHTSQREPCQRNIMRAGHPAISRPHDSGETINATDTVVFDTWRELRIRGSCLMFGRGTNSRLGTQRRPWVFLAQTFSARQLLRV